MRTFAVVNNVKTTITRDSPVKFEWGVLILKICCLITVVLNTLPLKAAHSAALLPQSLSLLSLFIFIISKHQHHWQSSEPHSRTFVRYCRCHRCCCHRWCMMSTWTTLLSLWHRYRCTTLLLLLPSILNAAAAAAIAAAARRCCWPRWCTTLTSLPSLPHKH